MTKAEFKKRWESNGDGGGITFEDIADCADRWGIALRPKTMSMFQLRFEVLRAAKTEDYESFNPSIL